MHVHENVYLSLASVNASVKRSQIKNPFSIKGTIYDYFMKKVVFYRFSGANPAQGATRFHTSVPTLRWERERSSMYHDFDALEFLHNYYNTYL